MQEILLKAVISLSIIINIILSLRYVSGRLIEYYKKKKIRRERRLKRFIHKVVHDYLVSIAKEK
jgi:hypothetical protein